MASHKSLDGSASSPDTRARLANLYAVVKSRCLRVPRLASQLLIATALLLTLVCLVPSQTKQSFLGADFSNHWKWPYSSTAPGSPIYNVSSGGPVRMVVFGTPDVASPSKSKGKSGPSWTEALCAEKLLVPVADQANLGVDYRHVEKQYPLASTADIAHQVSQFLKGPKQTNPPKETIWVFSFGTWDIWTLAALPREVSQGLVQNMVEHLFSQIELLYKASLLVDSPAYSDFWAYTNASLLESLNGNPSADTVESFRIVIPELFDLSLTPGWHTQRPTPPVPHSKAEHMVNAAFLVDHWNSEVSGRMDAWTRLADPEPAHDDTDAPKRPTDAEGKPYFGLWSPTGKSSGKAMDPVSAIGVASAVISFVDFSIKIIRGAIRIYGDANRDNDWQMPEDVAEKMIKLVRNLRQTSGFGVTPDEKEIAELAKTCMTLAERLAALFKSLRPKDARSKRQCLWAAVKAKHKQADVEDLENKLRTCRDQLQLHLTHSDFLNGKNMKNALETMILQREADSAKFSSLFTSIESLKEAVMTI
ncbi:hypothetical protein ACHAPN_006334 [Verticillium nonalfalfae]